MATTALHSADEPQKTRFGFPRRSRIGVSISVFFQRFMFKSAAVRNPSPVTGIVCVTAYEGSSEKPDCRRVLRDWQAS